LSPFLARVTRSLTVGAAGDSAGPSGIRVQVASALIGFSSYVPNR